MNGYEDLSAPAGERLRSYRALEILERIGGDDAHELLTRLAKGDPAAQLTREARAVLERKAIRNDVDEPFVADPARPEERVIPKLDAPKPNAAPPAHHGAGAEIPWILILYLIPLFILAGINIYRAMKRPVA